MLRAERCDKCVVFSSVDPLDQIARCGEHFLDRFNIHVSTNTLGLISIHVGTHGGPHTRFHKTLSTSLQFDVSSREFFPWTSTWLGSQKCVEVPNVSQPASHQVSTSSCLVSRLACASKSTQHVSPCSAEQEKNLNCDMDTVLERCQSDPIPRRSRFLESHTGSLLLGPLPAFAA